MRRRKWLIFAAVLMLLALVVLAGLDGRMIIRRYEVESDLIDQPVKLAVLTDLHGCDYGPDGEALLADVRELQPDVILLVGDMFSPDGDPHEELRIFSSLAQIAPACYVSGNHEYWEYNVPALNTMIADTGVTVLDQESMLIDVRGQRIALCGVPDPLAQDYVGAPGLMTQLERAAQDVPPDVCTVLLAHRPELIADYAASGHFDLVLCGHAHGGQIRVPLLINGLYAPNQGWFPDYAGGEYSVGETTMIVSRGLSTQTQMGIPRVFNRPELLLVTLE